MVRMFLAGAVLVSSLGATAPASASAPAVTLERSKDGVARLEARFTVAAGTKTVWEVLTDYDAMPRFVSALERSRAVRGPDGSLTVEQTASGRFLFLARRISLTLSVHEVPGELISFIHVPPSSFRRYEGSWHLSTSPLGTEVAYELTADPGPSLGPRILAVGTLRRAVARQLRELRDEINRRELDRLAVSLLPTE